MIKVLYHANCPDGFLAAYTAWEKFGNKAEYIPAAYQSKLPIDDWRDHDVYILDFSLPGNQLLTLADRNNKVILIDHHKTAEDNLKILDGTRPNLEIIFNQSKCGAMLTWNYFHSDRIAAPDVYYYVQDRDLWLWQLPHSRAVSAWLYIQPKDFLHYYACVIPKSISEMIKFGTPIVKMQQMMVESMLHKVFIDWLDEYHVPMVNSPVLQSELGEAMLTMYPDHPFAAIFSFPKNTTSISWSLRSRPDFDVSAVAKRYGGGGHLQAAGFMVDLS